MTHLFQFNELFLGERAGFVTDRVRIVLVVKTLETHHLGSVSSIDPGEGPQHHHRDDAAAAWRAENRDAAV